MQNLSFTKSSLHAAYADGLTPADVVREVYARLERIADPAIFIHLRPMEDVLKDAGALPAQSEDMPLWGVPFAVKDNIDVAGCPTTAACPDYAYTPEQDAFVVAKLRAAGALVIGKTNLDQFATGLVGVRSPYGVPRNAVDPEIVPGGSSAGSGVVVGHGAVTFSLGTDTAGSGRVPAALNNIVGLKPSLGSISATGVVPACRSIETVSIFAETVDDAYAVFETVCAYDPADAYARKIAATPLSPPAAGLKIAVPSKESREFFGDDVQAESFEAALTRLSDNGNEIVEIDFAPLYAVAEMLYEGAWVAERYTVIEELMRQKPEAIHPTTKKIIGKAEELSAADAFRGMYRLQELAREAEAVLNDVDLLAVPTIPTFYSCADLEADPITPNSNLGIYTNFVNLLDMCGIAFPTAPRSDGRPGSLTLLGKSGMDGELASLARAFSAKENIAQDFRPQEMPMVVCGAHMSGMPLNHQLTSRGGRLIEATRTSAHYQFYALAGGPPARPGLLRVDDGKQIDVEVWALPRETAGDFICGIPSPLCIGMVELESGHKAQGFLVEPAGLAGAQDITDLGGWRAYVSQG